MKKFLLEEPVEITGPKGYIHKIIKHFCKGCRICVEFCPTQTLGLDERFKVAVLHPERCIGCRLCEMRCPDLAIFVAKAGKEK